MSCSPRAENAETRCLVIVALKSLVWLLLSLVAALRVILCILTLRAPVVVVLNVVDTSVLTLLLHLRQELIGISTASVSRRLRLTV